MIHSPQGEWTLKSRLKQLVLEKETERGERIQNLEISHATGLDNNTISRWMSPKPFSQISVKAALALCKYLDCELTDLLYIDRGEQQGVGQN